MKKTIWQKIREKRFEEEAYSEEQQRLDEEFEKEALEITNLTDHPQVDDAIFYAWEIGHEYGHKLVLHVLTAFAELLGTEPQWEPDDPTGENGGVSFNVIAAFGAFLRETRSGHGFDANTAFYVRGSYDVAWVSNEQWNAATETERRFADLSPEFGIRIRTTDDDLEEVQEELLTAVRSVSGMQLGWLLDLTDRTVYVYRRMGDYPTPPQIEHLKAPVELYADPVLPGFTLKLAEIWGPYAHERSA